MNQECKDARRPGCQARLVLKDAEPSGRRPANDALATVLQYPHRLSRHWSRPPGRLAARYDDLLQSIAMHRNGGAPLEIFLGLARITQITPMRGLDPTAPSHPNLSWLVSRSSSWPGCHGTAQHSRVVAGGPEVPVVAAVTWQPF